MLEFLTVPILRQADGKNSHGEARLGEVQNVFATAVAILGIAVASRGFAALEDYVVVTVGPVIRTCRERVPALQCYQNRVLVVQC